MEKMTEFKRYRGMMRMFAIELAAVPQRRRESGGKARYKTIWSEWFTEVMEERKQHSSYVGGIKK